jgi:phage shock protein E
MDWIVVIIVVLVVVAFAALKRASFVSVEAARKHLAEGALVIDVRSPREFLAGHIPQAVNIPLEDLNEVLPQRLPEKNRVILLHCLSGTRSGMAKRQLRALGYPNVFNLGSYNRARQIVTGK